MGATANCDAVAVSLSGWYPRKSWPKNDLDLVYVVFFGDDVLCQVGGEGVQSGMAGCSLLCNNELHAQHDAT